MTKSWLFLVALMSSSFKIVSGKHLSETKLASATEKELSKAEEEFLGDVATLCQCLVRCLQVYNDNVEECRVLELVNGRQCFRYYDFTYVAYYPGFEDHTKILVSGGQSNDFDLTPDTSLEVIDMSKNDSNSNFCAKPKEENLRISPTGGLLDGTPIVCGGKDEKTVLKTCINPRSGKVVAEMTTERYGAASVVLKKTGSSPVLWVTGGKDSEQNILSSTEYVSMIGPSMSGPSLPRPNFGHCVTSFELTVMLIGGLKETSTKIFFLTKSMWLGWPKLNVARQFHTCGWITVNGGRTVVFIAAGGQGSNGTLLHSVEFLDLTKRKWELAQPLPKAVQLTTGVFVSREKMLILGGKDALGNVQSAIFMVSCHGMVEFESCQWTLTSQKMSAPRAGHVSMSAIDIAMSGLGLAEGCHNVEEKGNEPKFAPPQNFDKILLTGGITALSERVNDHSVKYVAGPAKELELLDPYDPNVICSNQSDYRGQIATEAPTGGYVGGVAVACGGYNYKTGSVGIDVTSDCKLSANGRKNTNIASMLTKRFGAASIVIDIDNVDNVLWITGGSRQLGDKFHPKPLLSTEYFSPNNGFSRHGPELPETKFKHCLLRLSDSTVLLASGKPKSTSSYFYDLKSGQWSSGPALGLEREHQVCGCIGNTDNWIAVVAGGALSADLDNAIDNVEMMSAIDLTWREGPPMPTPVMRAASVVAKGGQDFLVLSGLTARMKSSKAIQRLACARITDMASCQWTTLDKQLSEYRKDHLAILVPDALADCQ